MRKIDKVIVHCSASPRGRGDDASVIDRWHKERGFRSVDGDGTVYHIGYHYVIGDEGFTEKGRPDSMVGAHCKGENSNSIGICMIGDGDFIEVQYEALANLLRGLMEQYELGLEDIHGHYEYSSKTCPEFKIDWFINKYMK